MEKSLFLAQLGLPSVETLPLFFFAFNFFYSKEFKQHLNDIFTANIWKVMKFSNFSKIYF